MCLFKQTEQEWYNVFLIKTFILLSSSEHIHEHGNSFFRAPLWKLTVTLFSANKMQNKQCSTFPRSEGEGAQKQRNCSGICSRPSTIWPNHQVEHSLLYPILHIRADPGCSAVCSECADDKNNSTCDGYVLLDRILARFCLKQCGSKNNFQFVNLKGFDGDDRNFLISPGKLTCYQNYVKFRIWLKSLLACIMLTHPRNGGERAGTLWGTHSL